jgi:WD40-like Beta Propeller Repeat
MRPANGNAGPTNGASFLFQTREVEAMRQKSRNARAIRKGVVHRGRRLRAGMLGAFAALMVTSAWPASARPFSPWEPAQKIDEIGANSTELNTPSLDGCPIQAPDGLSLYMASNRPGGLGGIDIWVAHRTSTTAAWGAPENLGEPVNSAADDFCPTPIRGGGLFFVSREALPGSCGAADIYFTRRNPVQGWSEPVNLGCGANGGPNSALDEMGPSYVEAGGTDRLYFSSGPDIYVSERLADGTFGPASAVSELNSSANDIQPNVRKDGLEVVFASNRRAGTDQDIYTATRDSVDAPFSAPVSLGSAVNTTTASETRPSLSWDGTQLLFGRTPGPEGMTDIFVATRDKAAGGS